MISQEICDAANTALERCKEAEDGMLEAKLTAPSPDNYNVATEYVAALRNYADALEAWTEAMKEEFLS